MNTTNEIEIQDLSPESYATFRARATAVSSKLRSAINDLRRLHESALREQGHGEIEAQIIALEWVRTDLKNIL